MFIFLKQLKCALATTTTNNSFEFKIDKTKKSKLPPKIIGSQILLFCISLFAVIINPFFYTNFFDHEQYGIEERGTVCNGVLLSILFNIIQMLIGTLLFVELIELHEIQALTILLFFLIFLTFLCYFYSVGFFFYEKQHQKTDGEIQDLNKKKHFDRYLYFFQLSIGILNTCFTFCFIFFIGRVIKITNLNFIFIFLISCLVMMIFFVTTVRFIVKKNNIQKIEYEQIESNVDFTSNNEVNGYEGKDLEKERS